MESDVLNVEETEPVKGKDPSQNVPAPKQCGNPKGSSRSNSRGSRIVRKVNGRYRNSRNLYRQPARHSQRKSGYRKEGTSEPSHSTSLVAIHGHHFVVALLRQFIEAERTGNWEVHLQSLRDMLPIYVAAGHNLYAKSVYIYL